MWRLITDPDGVEAALAAEGDADGTDLERLVCGDRGLAARDRVAVYANAYFARIHDCLRDDFGALASALGADGFHDLVKTLLMMHPPTRPSLRHVGEPLAAHLATEPFASIFGRRCPWAADLARLEWAMMEAFFAADAPVLRREDLEWLSPEAWAGLRFVASPSLRLLTCAWPVHTVRERFDREGGIESGSESSALAAESTSLCVWRRSERVHYRSMTSLESDALGAAIAGESFAGICDRVAGTVGEDAAAREVAAMLASWVSEGLLAGVR